MGLIKVECCTCSQAAKDEFVETIFLIFPQSIIKHFFILNKQTIISIVCKILQEMKENKIKKKQTNYWISWRQYQIANERSVVTFKLECTMVCLYTSPRVCRLLWSGYNQSKKKKNIYISVGQARERVAVLCIQNPAGGREKKIKNYQTSK